MPRIRYLLWIAALSACARPASADPLATLLACNDRAVGGPALRALPGVEYDLQIAEKGYTVRGHYRAERANRVRIDIYAGDQRVYSEGWDSAGGGWQQPANAAEPEPSSPEGAASLRHGIERPGHLWTLADMPRLGNQVALVPRDSGDAPGAKVVKLTLRDGYETWYSVDTTSCLITRSRSFAAFHPDLDSTKTWNATIFTDFAVQNGVRRALTTLNVDVVTGDTLGTTRVLAVRPVEE